MQPRSVLVLVSLATILAAACESGPERASSASYTDRVQTLLETRCLRCHADPAPAGGWSAGGYLDAIGCTPSGEPAIAAALARPDHAGWLDANERSILQQWLATGASRSGGGVHPAAFANPRAPDSHGRLLRARRHAPLHDPDDVDACGRCHEGAPNRPASLPAPGAPACTSCHAEPGGALACGTCHGSGARAYPPRDRCFFPAEPDDRAHAAHAEPNASRSAGLPCSTCHPTPGTGMPEGVHANGWVDVWFDFAIAGREARFEASDRRCTGTCHARGGARPSPTWNEGRMTCNDCHGSPPRDHYRGACTSCHREADAEGTRLASPSLHLNGKVDLGDGSGRCGACHGRGDDPWPTTGAHSAHASPANARAVPCSTCHELPAGKHPLGGGATVKLAGLAVRGGRRATFDPTTKTCADTYCHAGGSAPAPRWTDPGPSTCTSCHGAPPAPPHVQATNCSASSCHAGRTDNGTLTPAARPAHVDGVIDRALP